MSARIYRRRESSSTTSISPCQQINARMLRKRSSCDERRESSSCEVFVGPPIAENSPLADAFLDQSYASASLVTFLSSEFMHLGKKPRRCSPRSSRSSSSSSSDSASDCESCLCEAVFDIIEPTIVCPEEATVAPKTTVNLVRENTKVWNVPRPAEGQRITVSTAPASLTIWDFPDDIYVFGVESGGVTFYVHAPSQAEDTFLMLKTGESLDAIQDRHSDPRCFKHVYKEELGKQVLQPVSDDQLGVALEDGYAVVKPIAEAEGWKLE